MLTTGQSFNMVTQQDSNVMIGHSTTMKAIAAVTMFFLPATTIAVGLVVFHSLWQSRNKPRNYILFDMADLSINRLYLAANSSVQTMITKPS